MQIISYMLKRRSIVVTPTDRPKSVRDRCVIEVFDDVFVSLLCFGGSVTKGDCAIWLGQISSFFSYNELPFEGQFIACHLPSHKISIYTCKWIPGPLCLQFYHVYWMFSVLKLVEIVILWVYFIIPFDFRLFRPFGASLFIFLKLHCLAEDHW